MDACSGRVEVLHSYRWGTVCDDGWITADAQVVCREVGCGAPLFTPGSAYFGPGTGPIWMDDTTCTGDEPSLITCQSKGFGVHNCNHSEDAGVICSVQSRNIEVGTDGHTAYTSSGPHEHGHITFLKVWSNSTCITG
nr:PREDICTED: scavenger receptor cysteine-rich domain-containing group B protein-like [Lepisosteus oculatus]